MSGKSKSKVGQKYLIGLMYIWGVCFSVLLFFFLNRGQILEIVFVSLIILVPVICSFLILQRKNRQLTAAEQQLSQTSAAVQINKADHEDQKRLQHYEQLSVLGELAAGIAHEIRNPLTSLKGFIQIVEADCVNTKKYTEIMSSEVDRINEIVNEMLILSKPKIIKSEEKKLQPILEMVVTLASTQAILYNIEIIVDIEETLQDVEIKCEENKIKQVFINIIKNAIEAMSNGGKITIGVKSNSDEIAVYFADEGDGIPKDQLEKVGKSFFSTKEKGTGLGLTICRRIIEEHGGKFLIHSEEGKGTIVEIRLPVANGVMVTDQ